MDYLINIDNGGTLTDICVAGKEGLFYTKTLTTPADLSECFFTGITKAAEKVTGESTASALLQKTDLIRYSSTQGTNALVERKGPSIGIVTDEPDFMEQIRYDDATSSLFDELVGSRVSVIDTVDGDDEMDATLVQAVNSLTTAGAERLVVAISDPEHEKKLKRIFLKRFPRHLLGSVPVLFSWEFAADSLRTRRLWSAILNTFLHPTLERFLYSAEHRRRAHKVKNPLLIYRNDGASSRVAKSVALKTYSSGPRGGLEGTRALASAYDIPHVLMIDVGGTTTDVGSVEDLQIATDRKGRVNGIPTSFELSDVQSKGVGGSSIFRVVDGEITVGPESVGAAPGPACFGFGGTEATITDVNLLLGILDPETYLNGELRLDPERSQQVIQKNIADPLDIDIDQALLRLEQAHSEKIAEAFSSQVRTDGTTTLAAFGGGGPMSACHAARVAGVNQVLIPRLAAVFSAYGISFSDIAQSYEAEITELGSSEVDTIHTDFLDQAERYMFQEGYAIDECDLVWSIIVENEDGSEHSRHDLDESVALESGQRKILRLDARHSLPHPALTATLPVAEGAAESSASRSVLTADGERKSTPVYVLEDQAPNAAGVGPAIVEGPFFTARVPEQWEFVVSDTNDLILTDHA
ncbi:hydantoinase/oxoprolinase family protein [Brevibacterium aurantiacum]|uniref:Acetophenone carboxylase subunit Apc1 n=1 Tax=Brevibacterium aurantiacum TaxID=273384 RepID=A0A1D7W853_BREAU|nr:hydantoinase/oxoprolinase family protein [Brevibacterium aurantiacum]AOP55174.1 Acetophenone carboxylase subunit Apc1 [Brevibacterium aurantiacum]RCS97507.1 hydantoinase/oxoprolinase family protein [Brevibacterium aurantiacum]